MPSALTVADPRCESRRDPLGIDEREPRLSWTLVSPERGQRQSAYRVLVASSPELLAREQGDLWDSGRVESGQVSQVVYRGRALASRERAWWSVRAWDSHGEATPWSAPAWWEMGLLAAGEWSATWIGIAPRGADERLPLARATWIREAEGANVPETKGFLQVRRSFELPEGVIASAWLRFVADGTGDPWNHQRPYLAVNGKTLDAWRWLWRMRSPAAWDVREQLKNGANTLALQAHRNDGAAFIGLLTVEYADGRVVEIASSREWQARVVEAPGLEGGDGWAAAREVGAFGAGPFAAGHIYDRMDKLVPAVYLHADFAIDKPLKRARVYATAAGVYELRLNGRRVGDHELAPGWTNYRKRIQYQTHDVTALLRVGENGLGALLGDGWFSGSQFHGANVHGTEKALRLQLHLDFADGSSRVIVSDESWRGGTGAIRAADVWHGEEVDERRDLLGWCGHRAIDATQWRAVKTVSVEHGPLVAQPDEPVRVTATLPARSVVEQRPGVFIADFGQNLAGRVRIALRAPAGTRLRLRHAEMLAKDGSIYVENLRGARATDTYTCRGGGEVYEPRLVFHGFRYCEITGLPGAPTPDDLSVSVLNSDCPQGGAFSCSEPRLMQLQSNIRWGQRSNFLSIPTDCPQRDERAGWTGDAQIFVRTATFNMDCAPFYHKYQQDMVDAQHANGAYPDVAPSDGIDSGHFGWGDAGVIVPWTIWQVYGDTRIIARNLDSMVKWIDHRTAKAKEVNYSDWNYGDWVSPPPQTPSEVLAPIYHAWTARLVGEMAAAIGKADVAKRYQAEAEAIVGAWRAKHLAADGRITSDTQAAYVLALRGGVIPEAQRANVARHLVAAVERAGWHLHTGFLGTGHLLPALSEIGRDDVAFRLLLTDTYPSWLYTVKHGATTMWERWDSYSVEFGPLNTGNMNSYNHYAFGAVGEWMYAAIAGIDLASPGYERIVIRPRHGGALTHARGEYRSARGPIVSAWRIEGGRFLLDVEIPPGATAEVHLPTRDAEKVEESGKPAAQAEAVRLARASADEAVFAVASGRYRFSAPL